MYIEYKWTGIQSTTREHIMHEKRREKPYTGGGEGLSKSRASHNAAAFYIVK